MTIIGDLLPLETAANIWLQTVGCFVLVSKLTRLSVINPLGISLHHAELTKAKKHKTGFPKIFSIDSDYRGLHY